MAKRHHDQAIENATQQFWASGYGGTTMRQLQTVMDMRPGSIYAAFGDKDKLYEKAIVRYTDQSILAIQTTMASAQTAEQGLLSSIKWMVFPTESSPSPLCFLVKTINELETRQPELVKVAKENMLRVRSEFARQVQFVLAEKGWPTEASQSQSEIVAATVQAMIIGLKAQLKLTGDVQLIDHCIDEFVASQFVNFRKPL